MTVRCDLHGVVALLTLDDAAHHNALSRALVADMLKAVQALQGRDVRTIVVSGAGKFFCAGANIHDLHEGRWLSAQPAPDNPVMLFEALATHRLPVVAAIQGPALGGGFELALSCDLAVMSRSAYLATPEVGLGVIPNTAMARLGALIGSRRALEIMYTRRKVGADEALALGLVNELADAEQVVEAALALARRIVTGAPPGALAELKQGLSRHQRTDWNEVRACLARLPEAQWQEGLSAFAEKRASDYERFWAEHADLGKPTA
jgi:enoyl-CoA hydratase/carnithine racemase